MQLLSVSCCGVRCHNAWCSSFSRKSAAWQSRPWSWNEGWASLRNSLRMSSKRRQSCRRCCMKAIASWIHWEWKCGDKTAQKQRHLQWDLQSVMMRVIAYGWITGHVMRVCFLRQRYYLLSSVVFLVSAEDFDWYCIYQHYVFDFSQSARSWKDSCQQRGKWWLTSTTPTILGSLWWNWEMFCTSGMNLRLKSTHWRKNCNNTNQSTEYFFLSFLCLSGCLFECVGIFLCLLRITTEFCFW